MMNAFDESLRRLRQDRRQAVRDFAWRHNVTTGDRYAADRDLREVESRLMELAALRRRV
jgi:hypothetical protein